MTDLVDSNALAYSGRALPPAVQAERARRWGWWYQAEWRLISMKAYWTSAVGSSLLTPVLYLVAMGVGLGTLVDAGSGGVAGVPYLTFVAPGLLVSTVVMSAGSEMTFPVMDGFKWSKLYFARSATAASRAHSGAAESWRQPRGQSATMAARSPKAAMIESGVTWLRPNERTPGVSMTQP